MHGVYGDGDSLIDVALQMVHVVVVAWCDMLSVQVGIAEKVDRFARVSTKGAEMVGDGPRPEMLEEGRDGE